MPALRSRPYFCLALLLVFATAPARVFAADIGVTAKKVTVVDKTALNGTSKIVIKSKDGAVTSGPAGDPAELTGLVRIYYTDNTVNGASFDLPFPWIKNNGKVAKFQNKLAPAGPSEVKTAVVKAGKGYVVSSKDKGALDISSPPGALGVTVVFVVNNGIDASNNRSCTRFSVGDGSKIIHKTIGAGAGYKLTLKDGQPVACPTDCADGFMNGDETDVDCGGPTCSVCSDGATCNLGSDCGSGVCTGNICQSPTCTDGVQNQDETDVDCGGLSCAGCLDGEACVLASDCTSGVCTGNVCQVPTCSDGVNNQDETDVDCGGLTCAACPNGDACSAGSDCQSGVCTGNICQPPSCGDAVQNGDESDVDCGGTVCAPCGPGLSCGAGTDCTSTICSSGTCTTPTCADGALNQDESDVDCGGTICASCPAGSDCGSGTDCTSGVCTGNVCQSPTCSDGVQNQDETDIDCGGATCGPCGTGEMCGSGSDCSSGVCSGNLCQAATCSDGVQNQDETDIDCGGGTCGACGTGDSCSSGSDCVSLVCTGNICQASTCSDGVKNQNETDTDCGGVCGASCSLGDTCGGGGDCVSGVCTGNLCNCGTQIHTFSHNSNNGGVFDSAEWQGGTQLRTFSPECTVRIENPSGNIDLVGTLGDNFAVQTKTGFSTCFGSGAEDGDGCDVSSCPPAGFGSCQATRPSCSAALNGSGTATYRVQCNP